MEEIEINSTGKELEIADINFKNIPKEEFDEYTKDKIKSLDQKIKTYNDMSVKYNRYHYFLTLPQLLVNAAMTSSVLLDSENDTDYKTALASLGIFNAVLQSFSTSLKYGQKSQKMLDKQKFCTKLKTELELGILMTSITEEYKHDLIRKIKQIGI